MSLPYIALAQGAHKSDIPSALRSRREKLGLTRKQVAAALEIDPSTLQRWEMPEDAEFHRRIRAADHQRLMAYYDSVAQQKARESVPRGTLAIGADSVSEGQPDGKAGILAGTATTPRAALLRVRSRIAELTDGNEGRELRAFAIVERAADAFSAGGSTQPTSREDLIRLIESVGASVIKDLEEENDGR